MAQIEGIEHAIELISRLHMNAVLVITNASGDEGYEYDERLRQFAEMMKVLTIFAATNSVINLIARPMVTRFTACGMHTRTLIW